MSQITGEIGKWPLEHRDGVTGGELWVMTKDYQCLPDPMRELARQR